MATVLEQEEILSYPTSHNSWQSGEFLEDLKKLATQYIDQFFQDKRMHCGGSIPKYLLHCPQRLSRVMNYDIVRSVDTAYIALEQTVSVEEAANARRFGGATSDIKLVNETLNLLARSGIPQQFAGGMLLMYLEFVEGVEF